MRSFNIREMNIQELNRQFDSIRDALAILERSATLASASGQAAAISSLQTAVDSLRSQIAAGFGDIAPHAAHHVAAGSDPVQIDKTQVNNLVTDLAGKEPANANIQAHIASTANPHSTTAAQVGLGNCDNTSDVNKPVSTATQTALNAKEAAANKGSANGYAPLDASAKVPVSNLPTGLPPGAHASTHASGGSDPVAGMIGIFNDIMVAAAGSLTVASGEQYGRFGKGVVNGILTISAGGSVFCRGSLAVETGGDIINNGDIEVF